MYVFFYSHGCQLKYNFHFKRNGKYVCTTVSQFLCSRREQASNKLFYAILIPRAVSSFNSLECITITGGKNFIGLLAHIRVSNSYLDHTCQSGISLSSLSFIIYLFVYIFQPRLRPLQQQVN